MTLPPGTQEGLIIAAMLVASLFGLGKIWDIYSARGQGVKLAIRGLYWVQRFLHKRGLSADEADTKTLAEIRQIVGTDQLKYPE